MINQKEVAELKSATTAELHAVVNVMKMRIGAKLFVGDKDRAVAILETTKKELKDRMYCR